MQVYACEIEEYMQEVAAPYFERAGVADKVGCPELAADWPAAWNLLL
jgi:predicted O-methyltransferase YrrM